MFGLLRGGEARVGAALGRVLFHEHRHQRAGNSISRASTRARLSALILPAARSDSKRAFSARTPLAARTCSPCRHRCATTSGVDRHHRPQHREALGHRQRGVAPAPVLGLALDALAVGVGSSPRSAPSAAGRGRSSSTRTRCARLRDSSPEAQRAATPQGAPRTAPAIPRDHHLTGHRLEQLQQLDMVRLLESNRSGASRCGCASDTAGRCRGLRALERYSQRNRCSQPWMSSTG